MIRNVIYRVHSSANQNGRQKRFLGAFEKFQKAIISFVTSVGLHILPLGTTPTVWSFVKFDI